MAVAPPPPPREAVAPTSAARLTGRMKWFKADKGFGFVQPDGGGKDLFVHHSQLADGFKAPVAGAPVTFVVGKGPNGREQAQDVQPAK
ncbi:MAG: cold shock domain-containing protein [Anaerolineae bacterium]|nr:cold shock domain-containing protein [Anaerolineae bacterium]